MQRYTGDITPYSALGLPPEFWGACYAANGRTPMAAFVAIGAFHFIIPLRTLNRLARVCKWYFGIVHRKLMDCRRLFFKWGPVMAKRIVPYLVAREYPFKYTGRATKIVPIDGDMGYNRDVGLSILDTAVPLLNPEELAATRHAVSGISFFSIAPIDCIVAVFLSNIQVAMVEVREEHFIYRGTLTESDQAYYREKYGYDRGKWPGNYWVRIRLPLSFNPIPIGEPFINPSQLLCCISPVHWYEMDHTGRVEHVIKPYFEVIIKYFTHVIIDFRTASNVDYKWDDYVLVVDDSYNPMMTRSIVRQMPPQIHETTDAPDDPSPQQ